MKSDEMAGNRRKVLVMSACAIGGVGVGATGIALFTSMRPTAYALTRTIEAERQIVDVSKLKPGEYSTVNVGSFPAPVMVLRRTEAQLKALTDFVEDIQDPTSREPQQPYFAQNWFRSKVPEVLVVNLKCTYLNACVVGFYPADSPSMAHREQWRGGFFCPCCASSFDLAGRVHKGMPAQLNLQVPPYKFITQNEIRIGHVKDTF